MAEQASFVQEGVDRFREAFDSAVDSLDLQRVQRQLAQRRKRIEKQLSSSRRQWEKRTRQELKKVRTELRKNSFVKRVQSLQKDVADQIESGVDSLLSTLRIASKADVDRIDRKLGQLNRKLKDLERPRRANGEAAGV